VFLGTYTHTLDGKGRVVMPSGFRRDLENGCVVAKGQDGQLVVFAADDFEARAAEVLTRTQDRDGRRFSRTVFAGADLQALDKTGRLLVKPELREFAGLESPGEVAVIGVFDHVELWSRAKYEDDSVMGDQSYREEE